MFTGIVQSKATVIAIEGNDTFKTLTLSVEKEHLEQLNIGASIAINGVCLTVTQFELPSSDVVGKVQFDVIDETLKLTNLGNLKRGDKVNLERSVTFGTELGGHIVSGHVHDVVTVIDRFDSTDNCQLSLSIAPKWQKYVLYKGFVAINGCSLTVGQVSDEQFELHLIPETLNATNLGSVEVGSTLNLEVDQQTYSIVQTVERYLKVQKHS